MKKIIYLFLFAFILPAAISGQVKIQSFSSNVTSAYINEMIHFTVNWSSESSTPVNSIYVVYKDGKVDTVKATPIPGTVFQAHFYHAFSNPGVYDVEARNGNAVAFNIRITVSALNQAPVASNVSIIGDNVVGGTLTVNYSYGDTDGDLQGATTFRWLRDNVAIPGAVSQSYIKTASDLGSMIIAEVTPVAKTGILVGTPVKSSAIGPIINANQAPVITLFNIPQSAVENTSFGVSAKAIDPDGKDLDFQLLVGVLNKPGITYGPYRVSGSQNGEELSKQFVLDLPSGSYYLTLSAKDLSSAQATQTKYITVTTAVNPPKIKFISFSNTVYTGEDLALADTLICYTQSGGVLYTEYTQGNTVITDQLPVSNFVNQQSYVVVSPKRYFNNPGSVSVRQWFVDATGLSSSFLTVNANVLSRSTGVADQNTIPADYNLEQNFPNPFNPSTQISYSLPTASNVRLDVYNTVGQIARTLVDQSQSAGIHTVTFNADGLPSGIYFYRIVAGKYTSTKKLVIMK